MRSASTRAAAWVRLVPTNVVRSVPVATTARSVNARVSGVVRTSIRLERVVPAMYGTAFAYTTQSMSDLTGPKLAQAGMAKKPAEAPGRGPWRNRDHRKEGRLQVTWWRW